MNLRLYSYWRSSSAYRVRIALHHKKLPFDYVAVDLLKSEQRSIEHKARSPLGYVPCLEVDGHSYVESVAIIELLEELFPEAPLLPKTATARAHVRALVELVNSGTQPVQNLVVLQRFPEAERAPWAKYFIERGLAAYEALLSSLSSQGLRPGPFSYGDGVTTADAFLIPQLYNAARFDVSLEPFPLISRVQAATLELEAFQKARPEAQPDAPKTA